MDPERAIHVSRFILPVGDEIHFGVAYAAVNVAYVFALEVRGEPIGAEDFRNRLAGGHFPRIPHFPGDPPDLGVGTLVIRQAGRAHGPPAAYQANACVGELFDLPRQRQGYAVLVGQDEIAIAHARRQHKPTIVNLHLEHGFTRTEVEVITVWNAGDHCAGTQGRPFSHDHAGVRDELALLKHILAAREVVDPWPGVRPPRVVPVERFAPLAMRQPRNRVVVGLVGRQVEDQPVDPFAKKPVAHRL